MLVMTFNIRFENEADKENSWVNRREMVTELFRRYNPSILGTQEGMAPQLEYLKNDLTHYCLYAPQRQMDDVSQYPTLLFRRDSFVAHEGGEFWLSKTPDVHRSMSWDSAFPRMISYCRLGSVDGADHMWVAVTHLDHIGKEARIEQAKIIAEWVRQRDAPVILMGDFNDSPGSPAHRVLTSFETGLVDTWQVLGLKEDQASFTHHRFTGVARKTRMDWILVSRDFLVKDARIIKDHSENRYPSDHFPYLVELELKGS